MKQLFISLILVAIFSNCFSQGSISTIFQDESNGLNVIQGTVMVNDTKANGGTCMFRPATADGGTIWAGPYITVSAGNYLLQARIKVASNSASSGLFMLDVVSQYGIVVHSAIWIAPNMFKTNNEWQLITIPVTIPHGITNLEMRGMNFQPGITDVYMDYVQLIPSGFYSFYSEELTISGKGDVGIGTTTPREKLSVNGKIRAKEVKVESTNWPDYVFEEGYNVGTLKELESYIKANKHLPEIPSAKEVQANGVELGEMNKLLLKKVEELTLHLIEKDKNALQQNSELKLQAEKLSAFEERLKKLENADRKPEINVKK